MAIILIAFFTIVFLIWQYKIQVKRMKCKKCGKKAVFDRIHDYSKSSLFLDENKLLTNGVRKFSFTKPHFQIYKKEYFLFSSMKVNSMGLFHGSRMYKNNPFLGEFYPCKHDWNNPISSESSLYCGSCFKELFSHDDRVLYDVLQEDIWFD
jgi:hypothetical protein